MNPFFLPSRRGALFAIDHPPSSAGEQAVLYIPPFAEEMNKARRMVALQAAELARSGCRVLLLDLYGTGDSAGDFRDARWEFWLDDLTRAVEWLAGQGCRRVTLWGLRAGCLLALGLLHEGRVSADRLVLWQPVITGKQMLTQFLRLRIAAELAGDRGRETVASMREQLSRGEPLEVAGYELAPELAASIDAQNLSPPPQNVPVYWYEVASVGERPLSPVAATTVDAWRQAGIRVEAEVIKGEPFWMTQEVTLAPALLQATMTAMQTKPGPRLAYTPGAALRR